MPSRPTAALHALRRSFKTHLDSSFQIKKNAWADECMKQLKAGKAAPAELLGKQEPCWWPARNITVWFYLNSVPDGGQSMFKHLQTPGAEYYRQLGSLYRDLGITATPYAACGSESKTLCFEPKAGMAVVHFPATTEQYMCLPDPNTLHEGATAIAPKYIAQQFIWSSPIDPEAAGVHEHVRDVWKQVLARADGHLHDAAQQLGRLASDAAWVDTEGDDAAVAQLMRCAADKCTKEDRPNEAASLLMMAAQRAGVPKEHPDKVAQACRHALSDEQRCALEAASLLLAARGASPAWLPALIELGTRGGGRHNTSGLSKAHGLQPNALWQREPLAEYADLRLNRYIAQPYFHQINTAYPGLQLISQEPYIFVCRDFLAHEECQQLMTYFSTSTSQASSAVFKEQTDLRTSTSVIPRERDVTWLRERIAALANVSTEQLQATKMTRCALLYHPNPSSPDLSTRPDV